MATPMRPANNTARAESGNGAEKSSCVPDHGTHAIAGPESGPQRSEVFMSIGSGPGQVQRRTATPLTMTVSANLGRLANDDRAAGTGAAGANDAVGTDHGTGVSTKGHRGAEGNRADAMIRKERMLDSRTMIG